MLLNECIQLRLGKLRVIPLVMPMLAVANHINEYITVKFLAVTGGNFHTLNHSFGIITIYMHYRCLHHCCQRSTIIGTSCIIKICGKANLVVDNKMNSAASVISFQITHLQYFIHNSLAGNRCIAMY